jgi:SAM-dependent methyltransferase
MANQEMKDHWRESGENWVRLQESFDRMLRPFGEAALDALAVRPGERALDIGCGFGATLAALAEAGAEATGVDLSAPMVAAAAERVPGAIVRQADAQTDDLGGPYDAALSRFGVMFFDDPVAAFENVASAMTDDGRLAFVCWRSLAENPMFTTGTPRLLAELTDPPAPPAPDAPGPFAFADAQRVEAILGSAGWREVAVDPFDGECRLATDNSDGVEEAVQHVLANTVGRLFTRQVAPERQQDVLEQVRADLRAARTDGRLVFPGSAWLVTARR